MGTPDVRVYDLALLGWTSICDMQAANDEHMRHLASATLLPVALTMIWRDCECNLSRRLSRTPWLIEPFPRPGKEPLDVFKEYNCRPNSAEGDQKGYKLLPRHAAKNIRKL